MRRWFWARICRSLSILKPLTWSTKMYWSKWKVMKMITWRNYDRSHIHYLSIILIMRGCKRNLFDFIHWHSSTKQGGWLVMRTRSDFFASHLCSYALQSKSNNYSKVVHLFMFYIILNWAMSNEKALYLIFITHYVKISKHQFDLSKQLHPMG